jgi:hypothetical protein
MALQPRRQPPSYSLLWEPQILLCRKPFTKFNTLPLVSEFQLSLLSFIVDNMEKFQTHSDIHNINTRHKHDLHQPSANLTSYQKGAHYAGTKLFNTHPDSINSLNHDIKLLLLILNPGTRWGWVVSARPGRALPPGKEPQYPLDRRLGGPQSQSGHRDREEKSFASVRDQTLVVQSVDSHYTDCANPAPFKIRSSPFFWDMGWQSAKQYICNNMACFRWMQLCCCTNSNSCEFRKCDFCSCCNLDS